MKLKSKEVKNSENMEVMRYRMSDRDIFYGGGLVNGARSITLMTQVADRIMAREYGYVDTPVKVQNVRLFIPCRAGDYTEMIGRILGKDNGTVNIEVRQFKVCELPENPPYPSSIDMIENPQLCTAMILQYKERTGE